MLSTKFCLFCLGFNVLNLDPVLLRAGENTTWYSYTSKEYILQIKEANFHLTI